MGLAEKRIDHPQGISDVNGSPEPPPVLSPTMVISGNCFMLFTKSFVALKERRFVNTTARFCQRIPFDGSM